MGLLRYTIGRCYSRQMGRVYEDTRPSTPRIPRVTQALSRMTAQCTEASEDQYACGLAEPDADRLNSALLLLTNHPDVSGRECPRAPSVTPMFVGDAQPQGCSHDALFRRDSFPHTGTRGIQVGHQRPDVCEGMRTQRDIAPGDYHQGQHTALTAGLKQFGQRHIQSSSCRSRNAVASGVTTALLIEHAQNYCVLGLSNTGASSTRVSTAVTSAHDYHVENEFVPQPQTGQQVPAVYMSRLT